MKGGNHRTTIEGQVKGTLSYIFLAAGRVCLEAPWGLEPCTTEMMGSGSEDADDAALLKEGFAQVPSLVSASLCADIVANVSMAKGQVISNALQQEVSGELRTRVDSELQSSPALAKLVQQVFGVATFRVSEAKRLSVPCHAEPQAPHADDFHNRSLIGVVHLREGQQPTEAIPYDAAARYPTGVFIACGDCGAYVQVGDKAVLTPTAPRLPAPDSRDRAQNRTRTRARARPRTPDPGP